MSVNKVNNDGSLLRVAGGTLYADSPIGAIMPYGGSTAPAGWLFCRGQALLKSEYPDLYAVIGDTFTYSAQSTTFWLPDAEECSLVGTGQNNRRTSMIGNHDVFNLGEFKDDQIQTHTHLLSRESSDRGTTNGSDYRGNHVIIKMDSLRTVNTDLDTTTVRSGDVTRGKRLGVNYIIKAKQVAVPADFNDAIDDALNEFAKLISLVPLNNSSIVYDKSRIVGGIVTVCASISVPSGNYLVKENAVANIPNYGTTSIGYILPCLYRNIANGAEEPGYAFINPVGNLYPYYTKTEYNEIRINASYSSKV